MQKELLIICLLVFLFITSIPFIAVRLTKIVDPAFSIKGEEFIFFQTFFMIAGIAVAFAVADLNKK